MEEILKQITWYHGLSIACLAGFILCLILLVIIYKKLGMRNVLDYFHRKRNQEADGEGIHPSVYDTLAE